ncbi:MAG TPA: hypothetical protein VMV89_06920 [Candidatus Paceibacterota bacterium]|nr:hypothetical protein [Candidatus Paceibacterota bacterium]
MFQIFFFGFSPSASGADCREHYSKTNRRENQAEDYCGNWIVFRVRDVSVPVFPNLIKGENSKCDEWNPKNAKNNLSEHKENFGQRFVVGTVVVWVGHK